MLIALPAPVGDSLTTQEREVPCHACFDCPMGEFSELLSIVLAVHDGSPKGRSIKVFGD